MHKYLAIVLFISNLTNISFASHRIERFPLSAKFTDIPNECMYAILTYVTDITGTPRGNSVVAYTNDNDENKETWFINPQDLRPTIKYLYNLRLINQQLKNCIDSDAFSQDIIASLSHRFDRSDFPAKSRDQHWDKLSIATSIKAPAGYRYLDKYVTTSGAYDLLETALSMQSFFEETTCETASIIYSQGTDQGILYSVAPGQHKLLTPWFSVYIRIHGQYNHVAYLNLLISQTLFQRCTVKPWGTSTYKTYLKQCMPIPIPTHQEEIHHLANYFEPISATEIENLPAGSNIICNTDSLDDIWNRSQDTYSIESFDGKRLPEAITRSGFDNAKEKVQKSLYNFMSLKRYRNISKEPLDFSGKTVTQEDKSLLNYFKIPIINDAAPQDITQTRPDSPFIDTTPVYWQETPLLAVRQLNEKYMEFLYSEEEWLLFTADLTNKPHIQGEIKNRINTFELTKKALCSSNWTAVDRISFNPLSWGSHPYADKSYLWIKKDSVEKVVQKLGLNLMRQEK